MHAKNADDELIRLANTIARAAGHLLRDARSRPAAAAGLAEAAPRGYRRQAEPDAERRCAGDQPAPTSETLLALCARVAPNDKSTWSRPIRAGERGAPGPRGGIFPRRYVMLPFLEFCARLAIPLFDWQREAFGAATRRAADRFLTPLVGISVPRGDGEVVWLGCRGAVAACVRQPGRTSSARRSTRQVRASCWIMRGPSCGVIRRCRTRSTCRQTPCSTPRRIRAWTITSREHTASRGRHPDVVLYDEADWAQRCRAVFVAARGTGDRSAIRCLLVTSTVGRRQSGPLWTIKELAEHGDPRVLALALQNRSPQVTTGVSRSSAQDSAAGRVRARAPEPVGGCGGLVHVRRGRGRGDGTRLDAAARRRTRPDVRGIRGPRARERSDRPRAGARRGRARLHRSALDRLKAREPSRCNSPTWKPRSSSCPNASRFAAGASSAGKAWRPCSRSSGSACPWSCSRRRRRRTPKSGRSSRSDSSSRTIVLPKHDRLREELLNLTVDLGPQGVRRDRPRKGPPRPLRGRSWGRRRADDRRHLASPEFLRCVLRGWRARPSRPFAGAPLATAGLRYREDHDDDD